MRKKIVLLLLFVAGSLSALQAQNVALKTNLLYWATTTPNLGLEASVGRKHTVQLFYGLNPWKSSSGKSLRHWVLQPEYRYWFCESFNGWFVSIPSTPFFYIKKALADFVYQLKPLLITQRKSFCNCREATSRSPLRSDRLGGAVRFP